MDDEEDVFAKSMHMEEDRKTKIMQSTKNKIESRYNSRTNLSSLSSLNRSTSATMSDSPNRSERNSAIDLMTTNLNRDDEIDVSSADGDSDLEINEPIHQFDIRQELFERTASVPYPHSEEYQRLIVIGDVDVDEDVKYACRSLQTCMNIRAKWINSHPIGSQDLYSTRKQSFSTHVTKGPNPTSFRRRDPLEYNVFDTDIPPTTTNYMIRMEKGIGQVYSCTSKNEEHNRVSNVYSLDEYIKDYTTVRAHVYGGPTNSYAWKQLEILVAKFNIHLLLNGDRETDVQKCVPHRDFYNVRKVDTHVHHSACMNQKHLLRFIKFKMKNNANDVVIYRDGKYLTLGEVFKSLHLTAYDLSIDTLDMHAHTTFERFDRFNLKYNPAGQSRLREIFLKTDNHISGRYLADITREVLSDLESSKYQLVEWRLSIYGRREDEWKKLADWFYTHKLAHSNLRWLIQIPRLFHIYKANGEVNTFADMLSNIFAPLFAVTLDPKSNPALHYFLMTVVGFDSVDDESRPGHIRLAEGIVTADQWDSADNPSYEYWMYYMYANICSLNQLRGMRGFNTFQYRPHCGEAGDLDHLVSNYLLAHQINHGILLRKQPSLQYLYYLSQIGIAMSPLSNNKLFLDYNKNPFPRYFRIGLNVSLSTDDPLMFHFTKDALLEEYSVATQVWKFSPTDQCEIARNSVLQSGWEADFKRHFLGDDYQDIQETNVPLIRLKYRAETLAAEKQDIATKAAM